MAIVLVILFAYVAFLIYLNVKVDPGSKSIPAHLETSRRTLSLSIDFPKIFFIGLVVALIKEFIPFKALIQYISELIGFA